MNLLIKWTFLFAALMIAVNSSHGWSIGSKGRVDGPSIHSTYFLTPENAPHEVHAQVYAGTLVNGSCVYNAAYDLGTETIKTGDVIDIDAFRLKSIIGTGYTCMTIFYTSKQVVMETIQLNTDGINYTTTIPATSEVNVL